MATTKYAGGSGPDMSRNEDLAGQSVKNGNYTITYDENGYARSAKKDGGKSATSTIKTTHANDSVAHQNAYQAAQRGDWDAVGTYINEIGMQTPSKYTDEAGATTYDMTAANAYFSELADEFKYDHNDYYRGKVDAVYGEGAWDSGLTSGQLIAQQKAQANAGAYGGNAVPGTAARQQAALQGGVVTAGSNDMMKYLEAMYAQNLTSELAALKSAYDKNVAELESRNDAIAETYRTARNQAARENELQRMRMNTMALAQGLNTGATGQMAMAQNASYQGTMGNLWAQEAQKQSEVDLALAQLLNQYNSNVAQTTANINAKRNAALYEEAVRQSELVRKDQNAARDDVLTLIAGGVTPSAAMLAAAGMGQEELGLWQALANGGTSAQTTQPAAGNPANPGYNNGGLTRDQVWLMQNLLGVTADGLWGNQSSAAYGNKTADQAWAELSGRINGNYANVQDALSKAESSGRNVNSRASAIIEDAYIGGKITEKQARTLLAQYGL